MSDTEQSVDLAQSIVLQQRYSEALDNLTALMAALTCDEDVESEHRLRDKQLLELLDVLAPEVATLVREREHKVGYWYA